MNLFRIIFFISFIFNCCCFQIKTRIDGVSFREGLRHIHTPEHISSTHYLTVPQFKINKVSKPIYNNKIANIFFSCSTMNLYTITARMRSRYINRTDLRFYLNNNSEELITLILTILPDFNDKKSHYLILEVILNDDLIILEPLIKLMMEIIMIITIMEDKYLFIKNKNNRLNYNENFNNYRKMVFYKR